MSELLKKYESIDQSKLNEGAKKILNRVKTITADFTTDDAKNNKLADEVLNEIMKKFPDSVKIVKRTPKAKATPKKTHKATHTAKATQTTSSTAKSSNNIMSVAKEIQKAGESWKEAMERAKQVLKERKEQVVQKQKTELEKLFALVKTKKELQGFAFSKSDVVRDSERKSKSKGARVVTREGYTSNQYKQNVPNKLGRRYWESRENRSDRLAPNYQKDMPLLASGGQIQNLVSILNGKYNLYGMSLKQIHEESIMYLGKEDGELVFYEFIKENKGNEKLMKEFNKTAFADGGSTEQVSVYGINGIYYLKTKYGTVGQGYKTKKEAQRIADLVNTGKYKMTNWGAEPNYADGGSVGKKHLVGVFNEEQLRKGEDKIAIEKAQKETGLTYIQSKMIKKSGKPFMQVYLVSNEDYYNSNEFANGGSVNMDKHIWEGWTVGDFIEELEPTFNQIMRGSSWQKPFKTKDEVKAWAMDNQPYYKKNIPDVVNYFWAKVQSKDNYADGGEIKKLESSLLNAEKKYRKAILSEQVGIISNEELKREKTKLENIRAKVNEWYATKPIGKKMADGGMTNLTMQNVSFAKGGSVDVVKGAIKVGVFSKEDLKTGVFEKALAEKSEETGLTNIDLKTIFKGDKIFIELYLIPNEEAKKRFKIKKWYTKTYPTDELGEELDENNTFEDIWTSLHNGTDVYEVMGVGDSVIRERVFEETSKIYGVDYEYVYKKWLDSDDYAKGGELEKYKNQGWEKTNRSTQGFDVFSKKIDESIHYAVFDKKGNFLSRSKNNPEQAEMEAYQVITKHSFADGGSVSNERMYNFLQDDLQKLEEAIKSGDMEEVNKFFTYWLGSSGHLKSLETKTNERMYNFLKEDLEKLEVAVENNDTEEVERFFSYWGQHLESLKMAKGGDFALYKIQQKFKYALQPKWEDEKFQTGGRKFLTFAQAQDFKKKLQGLSSSMEYKVVKVGEDEKLADGGSLPFMTDPNFGNFQNTGAFADGGDLDKVIGKTTSGKSIYQKYNKIPDLSTDELREASRIHRDFYNKAKSEEERQMAINYSLAFNRMASEQAFAEKMSGKYELGGAFMMTDLAGHTGGSDGLGNPMPLSGVSGTYYTGLVGETGAMSSGELFMDGGAMAQNQQVINDASQSYVNYYLGEGAGQGIYKDGGSIPNNYEGRTPEDIWNSLSKQQRGHFLYDHVSEIEEYKNIERLPSSEIIKAYNSEWSSLDKDIKNRFTNHTREGQYAYGGKTKSRPSMRQLNIEQIASLTGTRNVGGVEKFVDDNNLTDSEVSNLMMGIGRGLISKGDFITALVGNENNPIQKEVIAFAKSDKAYKMADGGGIRSKEELNKIISKKEEIVKNLTPKQIAEMWNKNSFGVKEGISKPITVEEAKNSNMKMYLRNLLIENELTEEEQAKYFVDGGFMNNVYANGGSVGDVSGNYYSTTDFVSQNDLMDLAKSTFGQDWESGGDYDYDTEEIKMLVKKLGGGYKILYVDSEQREKFENAKSKYLPLLKNKSNDGDIFVIPNKKMSDGGFTPDVSDGTQFMSGVYANGGKIEIENIKVGDWLERKDDKAKAKVINITGDKYSTKIYIADIYGNEVTHPLDFVNIEKWKVINEPKRELERIKKVWAEQFSDKGYAKGGEISIYNLRKGDKVKTRKGVIETIVRRTGSGSYETIENEYTHSPESLEFVSRPSRKMADGGTIGSGKNGYVAFYKGKRIEVYADTMYEAQKTASQHFKARKDYDVNVVLAEVDGKPYINSTMFSDGGEMEVNNIDAELEDFDLDNLDPFETMQYDNYSKSMSKVDALQVLINTVEGDYSQLSPELAELAEMQISQEQWDEQSREMYGYANGGGVGFKPYGNTKGKFKITYIADGKKQSEIRETLEMAIDTAKRYKKYDEFSKIEVFDESGKKIMADGGFMNDVYANGGDLSDVDLNFDFETEGDAEFEYPQEVEKIKLLRGLINFDEVRGAVDYGKTKDNTDLQFYKKGKLVMTVKGDYDVDAEILDTEIDILGIKHRINYHPYDSMGGLDYSALKRELNKANFADGGFMNDVYAKGGELQGKFLAEIKVPYNFEYVVEDEYEFSRFLSKALTNKFNFGNGAWGVKIVKPLFEKDYSKKIVVEIEIPVGVTQGGGLDKFDVVEFMSKTLTKKWFGNGVWGVDVVKSFADGGSLMGVHDGTAFMQNPVYAEKGSYLQDNEGFMRADNEFNYRYPEKEVYIETLDEPIDLTSTVTIKSNEVVINPIDENIDLNDDNRVRARMTQSNRGSAENFGKINPRAFEFIDLPMPTSNTHKND